MISFPLVSIIIPTFNSQKTIGYCLESAINQTYQNIEIVLVDDGSEDDTIAIAEAKSVRRDKLKILRLEHEGVSNARNTGIEISQGDYIFFLDSDDLIDPKTIEVLIASFYGADEAVMSVCDCVRIKNSHEFYGRRCFPFVKKECLSWDKYSHELLYMNIGIGICSCLVRKSAIGSNRFNPNLTYFEDCDMVLKILEQSEGSVILFHESLYGVVENPYSATRDVSLEKTKKSIFDRVFFSKNAIKIAQQKGNKSIIDAANYFWITTHLCAYRFSIYEKCETADILRKKIIDYYKSNKPQKMKNHRLEMFLLMLGKAPYKAAFSVYCFFKHPRYEK